DPLERLGVAAPETARGAQRAVDLDHLAGAGSFVQAVDVLRDHRLHEARALELGERAVRRVRLRVRQHSESLRVEVPHLLRVAAEGLDRGVLHRVVPRPDPGRRPEVRDPALGRDAGARQDDARLAIANQLRQTLGAHRAIVRGNVEGFRFSTELAVRFAETDAQGVAHNAAYLVWFE